MVEIDPTLKRYSVRFKEKDKRKNKDDKLEVLRNIIGLADTNNVLDLVKEADKTRLLQNKNNPNLVKDDQTVVDINLYHMPSVHIRLTEEQANRLRKYEDIRWVEEEMPRYLDAETVPWGITRVQADTVDPTTRHRGYGVSVGILDTGIDFTHTDLKPNYKGGTSVVAGDTSPGDAGGPEFHGTHVAGTVAAAINNFGVVGVAPECWLYSIKTFDSKLQSNANVDVAEGIVWGTQNKMDVMNLSMSGTGFSQDEADAMQAAFNAGIFMSCSSGNNNIIIGNKPEVRYPAGLGGAFSIGATDNTDTIANFSTWGPVGYVDFVGPGVGVISDKPVNTTQSLDGTSMAAPHISGVYAMALANYRFSPCDTNVYSPQAKKLDHIFTAMVNSCDTLGQTQPGKASAVYGFGLPQIGTLLNILLGQT